MYALASINLATFSTVYINSAGSEINDI